LASVGGGTPAERLVEFSFAVTQPSSTVGLSAEQSFLLRDDKPEAQLQVKVPDLCEGSDPEDVSSVRPLAPAADDTQPAQQAA
jgi:hypothetical protein